MKIIAFSRRSPRYRGDCRCGADRDQHPGPGEIRELSAELSEHAARDEAAHDSCRVGIEHMVRLLWLGRLAVWLLTALAGLAVATLNLKQTIVGMFVSPPDLYFVGCGGYHPFEFRDSEFPAEIRSVSPL